MPGIRRRQTGGALPGVTAEAPFRCVIIGEGTLPLQCAELLLASGHEIVALAMPAADGGAWAAARRVPLLAPSDALAGALDACTFDYLFSVVNPNVIPASVLALPRLGAINYHDSPLPRYAGVHATSWALISGETEHGVTWHAMDAELDHGRILAREAIRIEPSDTALTLNAKCYEAAIRTFGELVQALAAGTAVGHAQDLSQRSYFGKHARPAAASVIDWTQPASSIDALARALEFGDFPNTMGTPKVVIGRFAFTCPRVHALAEPSTAEPGTVLRADSTGITVATGRGTARIPAITQLEGDPVAIDELVREGIVGVGDVLAVPRTTCDLLSARDRDAARREHYWIARLESLQPPLFRALTSAAMDTETGARETARLTIPIQVPERIDHAPPGERDARLCGALVALLTRLSGTAMVDFDVMSGETGAGGGPAVFATRLPCRVVIDATASFDVLANAVGRALADVAEHGPLARDVWSRMPTLRTGSAREWRHGLPVGVALACEPDAVHDGAMTLAIGRDGRVVLSFASSVDRADASDLARRLELLLAEAAGHADTAVGRLRLLSGEEWQRILFDWNATGAPATMTFVHRAFTECARRAPDDIAATYEGMDLSYGELERRSNRLAWELRERGVGRDARVGVCVPRSHDLLVALLGILKAGGAYVPLMPEHPPARTAAIISDATPAVIVTVDRVRGALAAHDASLLVLDDHATRLERHRGDIAPEPLEAPGSAAYVMYTSGSTGQPKGVIVPHEALANLAAWVGQLVPLSAGDSVMHRTPLAFDPSGLEIFAALTTGARLVLAKADGHRDLAYVLDLMDRERVTAVVFIPSVLAASVDLPGFARACRSLRLVICGGEALTAELVARLHAVSDAAVFNLYGPTEATIACTGWRARRDGSARGALPIGTPVPNVRAYVLDERLEPLPPAIEGELCIGGIQVASGYLERPALTADRFLSDPFTRDANARLYRTGDRAIWRRDGTLEFRGRFDDQVKIRGFRVEPGEIEHVIREHSQVRDCAVVCSGSAERARLVAYLVAAGSGPLHTGTIAAFVRERLPAHMVPSAFVVLDALPLTINGKLDQRALPRPAVDSEGRARTAPRTPTEVAISAIWAEVLGGPVAGVEDDFFTSGGNSLLATRVLTRVRERLGVEQPLRVMFDAPTVERLSAAVDAARGASPDRAGAPRTSDADDAAAEAPLSFAQELLWMLDRTHPGLWAYNLWDASRIAGPCDETALAAALDDVAARHPALRTAFVANADRVMLHSAPSVRVPLSVRDLRTVPAAERDAAARQLALDEIRRPFDLARAPLVRAVLLRTADDAALFVLVFHHFIADGWSRDVLVRDLAACYAARRDGTVAELPPLRLDYATFARSQRDAWTGSRAERELEFWTETLAGAPDLLELPTDHPRPSVATFAGATCRAVWPAALGEALRRTGADAGTTLFMTVFAGVQAVLARYSGQDDFVVGTPVAGRRATVAEDVVGYFAGVVPLRADVAGDPTFEQLLSRVRARCLSALEHQDVPFGALVAALGRPADPSHSPVFQVMLAVEEEVRAPLVLRGASVTTETLDVGSAKYDLWLTFTDTGDGIVASAEFRTDLFERSTMERLLEHVRVLLEAAAAAPQRPVSALPILTVADRAELARWNATQTSAPAACVHDLIAAQAARTPDAIAVTSDEGNLTYRQLDARANQLARYLARRGGSSGMLAGVCIEPSLDLLVTLIAVMKAGAAYVPLDPTYPSDRLAFMVRDSGIRTLITRGATASLLPEFQGTTVLVDGDVAMIAAESATAPETHVSPDQCAYVIYTSGSTGLPKGAMLPHRAVANYLQWMRDTIGASERDCVIQKAPVSFDASVWELYLPLASGGRVAIVRAETQREPLLLLGALATHRATVVQFVPSLLSAVLDAPGFATACRDVRLIVLGGEALPGDLVRRVREVLPDVQLLNLYGPTEAAVYATAYPVPRQCAEAVVPIGRPIANVQVHVMSGKAAQLLPAGIPGELVIAGAGVGTGYLERPDLTADRFVTDPFASRDGARMYRTGDRARWRRDGTLEFLGRFDDQVKIRGFRVELGEIEHVLAAHDDVRECAVVPRAVGNSPARLVAYVVARGGGLPPAAELRGWLAGRLPEHMVPALFVQLPALPLGVTGKLDRRALPEPAAEVTEYHAPHPGLEETVAATWCEAFAVQRIGRDEDFFYLGGHSLLAMRVVLRLGAQLGMQLPMRILFDGRTVAGVAAAIVREHPEASEAASLAQMLTALDELSDDQARELLVQ